MIIDNFYFAPKGQVFDFSVSLVSEKKSQKKASHGLLQENFYLFDLVGNYTTEEQKELLIYFELLVHEIRKTYKDPFILKLYDKNVLYVYSAELEAKLVLKEAPVDPVKEAYLAFIESEIQALKNRADEYNLLWNDNIDRELNYLKREACLDAKNVWVNIKRSYIDNYERIEHAEFVNKAG